MITCPSNKIYNPISKRCVKKSGLIGKKLVCENKFLSWENNSCYIDSLLVSLFINNDSFIRDILLNAKINDYGSSELKILGKNIRDNLKLIYDYINNSNLKENITCHNLRISLNKYYKLLKKIKHINLINSSDNWTNTQNDVFELFEFFKLIFDIKNTTKFIDANNPPNYSDFSTLLPIDFLLNTDKPLKINKIYPISKVKYTLKDGNEFINKYGKKQKTYYKTTEILKADKLFIKIYRNIGSFKLDTQIIPAKSLKLKENNFKLYLNSIIIHYGSNNGGHYTCIFKCNNKWYEYNDMKNKHIFIGTLSDVYKNPNYSSNIIGLIYSK
jgi:hypothetical protein